MTIYEKDSLPDYIEKTVEKDRILHKKQGPLQIRQADLQLVGEISEETLKKNVARFNKKVKAFKKLNNISYQDRASGTSNREILANAFEEVAQTPYERSRIREYRKEVQRLDGLQEQL